MDQEDSRVLAKSYEDDFDSKWYLNRYKEVTTWHEQPLRLLQEVYASYGTPPAGLKVLNFGTGPVIAYEISAPLQASEIVFADYAKQNRTMLQQWLDNDPEAHDWSSFFKFVVTKLEGKSTEEASSREDQLRKLVKAIVTCDITQDPPIQAGYEGPYDIVVSSLCLEYAFSSLKGYAEGLSRLSKLVKPGGKLCLNSIEGQGVTHAYIMDTQWFYGLNLTAEKLTTMLTEKGFHDIQVTRQPHDREKLTGPQKKGTSTAMLFVTATKDL